MTSSQFGEQGTAVRGALVGAVALSLGLAALVCADPFALPYFDFAWLRWFPFELTACVFLALVILAVMVMSGGWMWRHRDIIVAASMFSGAQMIGLNLLKLDPLEMVTVPVTLLWLALILTGQVGSLRTSGNLMMMGGFVFCALLPLVQAYPMLLAAGLAALLVKFVDYFLLTQFIRTRKGLDTALKGFMAVTVGSSIIGILQVGLYMSTGIVFTLSDTMEDLFKPTPFGQMLRATALCPKPQHLAGFLIFGLPLLLFSAFEPGRTRGRRFLLLTGATLTCLALGLTWAVGAWMATCLVLLLFVYLRWPWRAIHVTVLLSLTVVLGWVSGLFQWVYARYLAHSGVLRGNEQRLFLLSLALEKLQRSLWIGVGPRQFFRFDGNYRQFPVHNAYFQAATEAGLGGGILYAAILGYAGVRLIYYCSTAGTPADQRLCRMLLLALFALSWNGMSEPVYDHSNTWVSLGLLEGAILTLACRPRSTTALSAATARG